MSRKVLKLVSPLEKQDTPILILAGGLGTRLSEETSHTPKPMIEIGGIPILVHIMRYYYSFGFNNFVICAGYKSYSIKRFFQNYGLMCAGLDLDTRSSDSASLKIIDRSNEQEKWRVRVLETGTYAMTGGRVRRALDFIAQTDKIEHFGLTYGDGLTDADLSAEFAFHCEHNRIGTVLGVKNTARYGELDVNGDGVASFLEKPTERQGFISGGYFFFQSKFRDYLQPGDESLVLEKAPLSKLASEGELKVFKHLGFWQAMDTQRDRLQLQALWESKQTPWIRKEEANDSTRIDTNHRIKRISRK